MKILFIGSNPKEAGGIETFGRNLQEIFGSKIHFYSISEGNCIYEVPNVYKTFKKNLVGKILNKLTLKKLPYLHLNYLIKRYKYEYLIINSPQALDMLSKENLDKKIILVQHQTANRYYKSPNFLNKNPKVLENQKKYVDKMIMLSPQDLEEFSKKFDLKKENLVCIRHSSKLPIIKFEKQKNKKLITICRMENNQKRIDLMLEGMKYLEEFQLEIWGEGPDKLKLERKAKSMELKNVKFMGKTANVKEKLDEASIFLMTSDFEGYGITLIEATRRGLPIIVRNTYAAAKDIVNSNGILLNENWEVEKFVKAVRKIYENYKFYNKEALQEAEKYELSIISKQWKEILKI